MRNYITDQMEASFGILGFLPRYRDRQPAPIVLQSGEAHLNNINVQNSDIGMLTLLLAEPRT